MRVWSTFNPAAPGPIGGTTQAAITGTTITATQQFVTPAGSVGTPAVAIGTGTGIYSSVANRMDFVMSGGSRLSVSPGEVKVGSTTSFKWGSTTDPVSATDLLLGRDSAGVLAQRDGTSAQESRLYGTFTDASNYERLVARTAAGDYLIAAEAAGTGTLRGQVFGASGGRVGFFGVSAVARAAAYTPTNVTTDRAYDANATTVEELADVLGTLIADLKAYGLLQ